MTFWAFGFCMLATGFLLGLGAMGLVVWIAAAHHFEQLAKTTDEIRIVISRPVDGGADGC